MLACQTTSLVFSLTGSQTAGKEAAITSWHISGKKESIYKKVTKSSAVVFTVN